MPVTRLSGNESSDNDPEGTKTDLDPTKEHHFFFFFFFLQILLMMTPQFTGLTNSGEVAVARVHLNIVYSITLHLQPISRY